jgi:hypothetical protein
MEMRVRPALDDRYIPPLPMWSAKPRDCGVSSHILSGSVDQRRCWLRVPFVGKAGAYTNLHQLLENLHVYWVLANLHPTYIQLTCCAKYKMITYRIMILKPIIYLKEGATYVNTRTPVPVTSSRPTRRQLPSLPRA